ncbi:MAG: sulfotransferase [Aureliella sp.]
MKSRIANKLLAFYGLAHWDSSGLEDTVLITGTGRSGTTWFGEVLNSQNDFRVIFEPFNNHKVGVVRRWRDREYLCFDSEPSLRAEVGRIITGDIRSLWTDQFNRRLFATRRLIKAIRSHFLTGYIAQEFPGVKQLLVIRNPRAVAQSKMKLGWKASLEPYLGNSSLISGFFSGVATTVASLEDPFDIFVAQWCMENYVALKHLGYKENAKVVFYEDLVASPGEYFPPIFEFVGLDFGLVTQEALSAASRMAGKRDSGRSNQRETGYRERCLKLTELFGMHSLYGDRDKPLVSADDAAAVAFSDLPTSNRVC